MVFIKELQRQYKASSGNSQTALSRSGPIRVRPVTRRVRFVRRRWLVLGGVAGTALILAASGVLREAGTGAPPAPAETRVIELALPGPAPMLDEPFSRPDSSTPIPSTRPNSTPSSTLSDPAADALPVSDAPMTASVEKPAAAPSPPVAVPSDSEPGSVSTAAAAIEPDPASITDRAGEADPPTDVEETSVANPAHRVTVRRGDSLYLIFKRLGLHQRDLALMTSSKKLARKLARIAPGQEIEFFLDADSRLIRLVHRLDGIRSVQVTRDGDNFAFEEIVEPPEVAVSTASGVIDSSLFLAGQNEGLSDNIIMQMAEIFGWDVDFALDIRAGDRFALIYEEQFNDGKKVGEGPIVAAEFTNRGRRIRALRYVSPSGRADYFSPDGRSMRKQFLRTPVNFTRISSRFSFSRRHPVLHKMRAHRGVDYAAPRGTAVKASSDGRVIFAGRNGGYGRTIILKHGATYTTLYAHLNGIAKGIRPGKRVVQGQTIGYVGSTGLATGPHLHYEFRVRGVHRDPLKVKLPAAAPLADEYMAGFREKAQPLLANLELIGGTSVATAEQSGK